MLEDLKEQVYQANLDLHKFKLITLTWGNVSGIDRQQELMVIKPSGISYENMKASDMVVVNFEGKVIEGNLKASSDTPTHLGLYKSFTNICAIAHSHSLYATIFAQACREIHCLGTTHADYFHGNIPVTRFMTEQEVEQDYELNTGNVIVERFTTLNPIEMPAVLVAGHGPFTWGKDPDDAVKNSLVLEKVAHLAIGTLQVEPGIQPLPEYIVRKHYSRKHGPDAYYGQKNKIKD